MYICDEMITHDKTSLTKRQTFCQWIRELRHDPGYIINTDSDIIPFETIKKDLRWFDTGPGVKKRYKAIREQDRTVIHVKPGMKNNTLVAKVWFTTMGERSTDYFSIPFNLDKITYYSISDNYFTLLKNYSHG